MRRVIYSHPYLYLLGSLLFLYSAAATIASPDQIVRPLTLLGLLVFVLLRLASRWSNDGTAAFLLSISVLSICSGISFFITSGVLSLIVVFLTWSVARYRRRRMTMTHANVLLTLVSASLVATLAVPYVRILSTLSKRPGIPPVAAAAIKPMGEPRDIYFIVLDGYGRADVLDDLYGFDNSQFIQFLESRGFFVPAASRSNYAKTVLSVTSTLNMDYIDSLQPSVDYHRYWWLASPHLNHSRVRSALERIGFLSVSVATGWNLTSNNTSDIYLSTRRFALNDFETFLVAKTPLRTLKPTLERFGVEADYDSHRAAILYTLETLAKIAPLPTPKFVFAHVFAPHPPFVFDAAGGSVQPTYPFGFDDANLFPLSTSAYRDGYVGQVGFVNNKLMSIVDAILLHSKTPPIIILQGDHGPRMFGDFLSHQRTCLKESFATFSAYLVPGAPKDLIPSTVSAVNIFRIIFNHYFNASFRLLESKNFYDDARGMVDVTEYVDSCSRE